MQRPAHIPRAASRLLLALLFIASSVIAAPTPGHRLVWQDEFNGTALDTGRWQYRTDTRYWSTQLPANVSVSNGLLNLHLKKETIGTINYTAGGVISRELFRYGYYEARMKVPPGSGWHTSFWMMKYNRPASDTVAIELDVIENDSVTPLKYGVNVHRHLPTPHVTFGNKNITTPSLSEDFHILGCEFTPSTIRYYFDGNLVQTVDATLLPHNDMNIWLTSIASPLGGTTSVDDSQLPAAAQFDYVRYYEPFPLPSVSITQPTSHAVTLADENHTLSLAASVGTETPPPVITWTQLQGPGTVVFSNPNGLATSASFSATGTYVIQAAATNEGGTTVDQIQVGVAAPTTLSLYQGLDGYSHTATIIRADQTSWNAGARDQLLLGRSNGAFRSVFSFPLTPLPADADITGVSLELHTSAAGSGTIGNPELRRLTATPVEGSGIADGSNPNTGSGTGTTWLTRTGGDQPGDLWSTPGGDFENNLLSTRNGFDATVSDRVFSLPDSPAFTAAARSAHATNQPLEFILSSTNEASSIAYARIASDDHPAPSMRPHLNLTFVGNRLPQIQLAPMTTLSGIPSPLEATVTGETGTVWEKISGPGTAVVENLFNPQTTATFNAPGVYQMRITATQPLGTVSRTLEATVNPNPAFFPQWQQITWPGVTDDSITGPNQDADHDGFCNILEWALHLNPSAPDHVIQALTPGPASCEYTYIRRIIAPDEAVYQVEWSDTLEGGWTTAGAMEHPPIQLTDTSETVRVSLPASPAGKRFVRLKVTVP